MRLTNEVVVPAPSERVFRLLADMERVAPQYLQLRVHRYLAGSYACEPSDHPQ